MSERARGFMVCVVAYLAASAAALAAGAALRAYGLVVHPLLLVAAADLVGTVVVFVLSVAVGNSSLYDPYWSVAPLFIAGFLWFAGGTPLSPRSAAVLALVLVWGVRLTWNWARGWRGLSHEDWRYLRIRERAGAAYWPVSFLGIHLMPTVMVYLGCLPLWPALSAGGRGSGWLDGVALVVTTAAVWIEATADRQLHRFVGQGPPPGAVLESGLWALSRHPNYFGEILFWWGLYLFGLAADPGRWWTGGGALAITLLFVFISLPLIERRMLERRGEAYRAVCRRRSLLIPWRPRPDEVDSGQEDLER